MTAVVVLLLVLAAAAIIYMAAKLAEARRTAESLEAKRSEAAAEIESLSRYRGIADADARAAQILRESQQAADRAATEATANAAAILGAATAKATQSTAEAESVLGQARQQAKALKDQAKATVDAATIQAATIIDGANARAEQIAGGAYEAMKNAALYEGTVKAMKNLIDGYGDQYIIPGHSLLDELAEEFGYTEAGEELKKARERTKAMIRNDTAATCDYVEANRRETAIRFVLDAFNGKVDSILSRVKSDNAGTLEQEVRDAFTLVNFNGKAFRDARVTEEYCAARLQELQWAAVAQQLKLEEREEQRRVKEQIREEEKARREYERAIRDAAKEEDALRKAMEKAQAAIAKASEEQRAQFEAQLLDLTQKLKEAEERNQRALSMAQQTRRGHVYIISNVGSFGEDVFKIGLTRRLEPLDRVRELGDSSVPFEFDVHALILSDDAPALETQLHKHFVLKQLNKVNHRKEFFRVPIKEIREEIEHFGLEAKWTMTAAAREYRETLAIEKAIRENPATQDAWVKRQYQLEVTDAAFDEDAAEQVATVGAAPVIGQPLAS